MSNDDWEQRAIALSAQLDQAAAELRDLVAAIRIESLGGENTQEGEDDDERPES
jgi:hypothetical protein